MQFYEFDFSAAETSVKKALDAMPDHVGTWLLAGWIALSLAEHESAWKRFETAYELDKNFGDSHGCMAIRYVMTGQIDKADRHIRLGEMLAPDSYAVQYAKMLKAQSLGDQATYDEGVASISETRIEWNNQRVKDLIERRQAALLEKQGKLH